MVEQNRSGTYTEIVYAPTGQKLALMNGQTVSKAFVPLPAGAQAVYSGTTLQYFRHPDWLGSARLTTTVGRAVYSDLAYGPFGETYAESGTPDRSFTGQNQDTIANSTTGLHDFMYREYAQYGRWISPDPAGVAAVDLTNPQSWNRYTYVINQPTNGIDPLELEGPNTKLYEIAPTVGWTSFSSLDFGYHYPGAGGNIITGETGSWQYVSGFAGQDNYYFDGDWVGATVYTGNGYWQFAGEVQTTSSSLPLGAGFVGSSGGQGGAGGGASGPANKGSQQPQQTSMGTPKTPEQCSIYLAGGTTSGKSLYVLCSKVFPNSPKSNTMRGCLQSLYDPKSGYLPVPIRVPILIPTPGPAMTDVNEIVPGTGAHAVCLAYTLGF